MKIRIFISLLTVIFSLNSMYAQSGYDAIVESIKGQALFKERENENPLPLREKQKLFEENWVNCGKGCRRLTLSICNIPHNIERDKWKEIRSRNCASLNESRIGNSKGEGIIIISPRDSETVEPEKFSLRWKPTQPSVKFNLIIEIFLARKEIFKETDIDGSKGFFESPDLLKALKSVQEAGKLNLEITLTENSDYENKAKIKKNQTVVFKLISTSDQENLYKKLKIYEDETDEISKAIARGLIFGEYRLFTEAEQELEKALKIAQSRNRDEKIITGISRLVIMASYQIYNDERVKQLCSSLKNSAPLPFPCLQSLDNE